MNRWFGWYQIQLCKQTARKISKQFFDQFNCNGAPWQNLPKLFRFFNGAIFELPWAISHLALELGTCDLGRDGAQTACLQLRQQGLDGAWKTSLTSCADPALGMANPGDSNWPIGSFFWKSAGFKQSISHMCWSTSDSCIVFQYSPQLSREPASIVVILEGGQHLLRWSAQMQRLPNSMSQISQVLQSIATYCKCQCFGFWTPDHDPHARPPTASPRGMAWLDLSRWKDQSNTSSS